jgi:hypothetical protein
MSNSVETIKGRLVMNELKMPEDMQAYAPAINQLMDWMPNGKWVSSDDYDSWYQDEKIPCFVPYDGNVRNFINPFHPYDESVRFIHTLRDEGFVDQKVTGDGKAFYRKRTNNGGNNASTKT